MRAEIMVCLGGRIAEELIYGTTGRTTGAYSDLKAATQIANIFLLSVITSVLQLEVGFNKYSQPQKRSAPANSIICGVWSLATG